MSCVGVKVGWSMQATTIAKAYILTLRAESTSVIDPTLIVCKVVGGSHSTTNRTAEVR